MVEIHRETSAELHGQKIICQFEKFTNPHLFATRGIHNCQYMYISGKKRPATAIIEIVWNKKYK